MGRFSRPQTSFLWNVSGVREHFALLKPVADVFEKDGQGFWIYRDETCYAWNRFGDPSEGQP